MAGPEQDIDEEDEQDLEKESDDTAGGGGGSGVAGFAVGILLGVLLGAGVALLYAPDSGDRTRRHLKRGIRRLRDEAEDGLDRAGAHAARVRKELTRRRRKLEAGIDRAADQMRDAFDE